MKKKIFSAFGVAVILTLTSHGLYSQNESDLIKALKNKNFVVTSEMYPALIADVSPEAARLFIEPMTRQYNRRVDQNYGDRAKEDRLYITHTKTAISLLDMVQMSREGSLRVSKLIEGMIPWEISLDQKMEFLELMAKAYISLPVE